MTAHRRRPWGIDRIPWQRLLSTREAWMWFALIVLAPAALLAGVLLQHRLTARIGIRIPATRAVAIAAARKYAVANGVKPDGWSTIMWVDANPTLNTYLLTHAGHNAEMLRRMLPTTTLHVRFTSPDDSQSMEVLLDPEARPTGFKRRQPRAMDTARRNEADAALHMAEENMRECVDTRMPQLPMPEQPEIDRKVNGEDVYTWESHAPDFPELTFSYSASVRGLTVLNSVLTPKLDPKFEQSLDPVPWLKPALKQIGALVAVVMFVFVFVRYVQRALQGEVSRERMLLVSVVVGSTYLLFMLCGDQVAMQTSQTDKGVPFWIIALFGGMVMMLLGAAAGVTYAGTEGDLRERYPSKLTSLDALLLGRFRNRNVGGAIVVGAALGAWLLFWHGLIELALGAPELGSDRLTLLQMIPFSRAPWAMFLLSAPSSALVASTLGFLLPKMFSLRFVAHRRGAFAIFFGLAYIATCALAERTSSTAPLLAGGLVRLGVMTLAFYTLDILTCMVLVGVLSLASTAAVLTEIAPGVSAQAQVAATAGYALLGLAVYGLWRGRLVADDQVRPQYARNVAERLQLEEELIATREAHARLLPQEPPAVDGVTLAATCHAANRVSGDFYDFFALAPHRVGILLAEGGKGGLATALSIALAKGYVTQKARAGLTPAALLQSLQRTLGALLEGQADLGGVLYAVVDTAEQTVQYACLGASPRLLSMPDTGSHLERAQRLGGGRVLREGSLPLEAGARVILYTKGLETRVSGGLDHWLRLRLRRHDDGDAKALQQTLIHELLTTGASRRASESLGDITFVVLSVAQRGDQVREQVA